MKKVLIVEDSVLIQKIIHDALETCFPCDIMAVNDGAKAYEELASNAYDLVITDIVMPVMDGLTLAEKIRLDLASDVPIIMLTSLGVKNVRESASSSGVNAYLTKPINLDHLTQIVNRLIPKEDPSATKDTSPPEQNAAPPVAVAPPPAQEAAPQPAHSPVQNETSPPEQDGAPPTVQEAVTQPEQPPVQNETSPAELDETSLPDIEEWSSKIDEDW